MDDDTLRSQADARLEQAIADERMRDPRPFYRERLRRLKEMDGAAFQQARRHYEDTLIPRIARDGADPVACWLEYGKLLVELGGPGRTVEVDAGGRARPHPAPADAERMVLHLPAEQSEPPLVLNLPVELSAAQQATFDVLIQKNFR